jgi:hypothetical protein
MEISWSQYVYCLSLIIINIYQIWTFSEGDMDITGPTERDRYHFSEGQTNPYRTRERSMLALSHDHRDYPYAIG